MSFTETPRLSRNDEKLLRAQSLRDLTHFLPELYAETELARLPVVIARVLAQLIPGEAHGIVVRDYASGQRLWYLHSSVPAFVAPPNGFFAGFRECDPENCPEREVEGDSLALVNLVTRASLRPLNFYHDIPRAFDATENFDVEIRRGEVVICAAILRRGRGFNRQEVRLMNALRPHLHQTWRNAEALIDLKAGATAARLSSPERDASALEVQLGLTPRESEVLLWVAQGKTNSDVAAILGITSHTVRTHLERVFAKLGVETRHAAGLCAMDVLRTPTGNSAEVA